MAERERPQPEEVLAWMAANRAGADVAAKHFGMPKSTVIFWMRRARTNPTPTRGTGSLHGGGNVTILQTPSPPPKAKMPKALQTQARKLIRQAFKRLEVVIDESDARECAVVITTLADRFDLFADLKTKAKTTEAAAPGTAEFEAEVMAELDKIPAHLLAEAQRRRAG